MTVQAPLIELNLEQNSGKAPDELLLCDPLTGANFVAGFDPAATFNRTVVSLFSGAGGLDIGLEQAGFETLACVEIDKDCRATLAYNRPDWKLIDGANGAGDVKSVSGDELLRQLHMRRGELGLIVGGPPCQPFSNLGKKQGKYDPSNGDLYAHYARLVDECLPEGFVFENVEGFAQEKHADVREHLLHQFKALGYEVSYGVLNAADYGDPQVRKRFVILGSRVTGFSALPLPSRFETLSKAEALYRRLSGSLPAAVSTWVTVGEALSDIPSWRLARDDNRVMGVSDLVKKRMQYVNQGENFKVLPLELRPPCWSSGKHQGHDTFGRLRANKPSVTIRTCAYNSAKGRYIHPFENRGLNTAEMAELQSFPHAWHFKCAGGRQNLVAIGRQIGNAVPVKLATALGTTMRYLLSR